MKRTLSMILVCAMVLALLSVIPFSVAAGDNTGPGDVEPDHPTEGKAINTAEEFAAMTADGNYYLAADITLTSTWGLETVKTTDEAGAEVVTYNLTAFKGTLDGNGKTVTVAAPMFAKVEDATIKNLNVVGAIATEGVTPFVSGSHDFVAAVAVIANGESVFQNIVSDVDITAAGENTRAGAVVATSEKLVTYAEDGTTVVAEKNINIVMTDCVNNGDISVVKYAGGVYGWTEAKGATFAFANCVNNGKISSTAGYVGGIINRVSHVDGGSATVENCVNNGEISGTTQLGGIMSYASGYVKFENCTNTAIITAVEGKATHAGGIVGSTQAESGVHFVNCVNTAGITGFGGNAAGGILGYANNASAVVEGCLNTGNVVSGGDGYAAGGIVGRANHKAENTIVAGYQIIIRNSVNTGDVTADQCIGGILGRIGVTNGLGIALVDSCINLGNVTAVSGGNKDATTDTGIAGIIGHSRASASESSQTIVNNCITTGNITVPAGMERVPSYLVGYSGGGANIILSNNKVSGQLIDGDAEAKVGGLMYLRSYDLAAQSPAGVEAMPTNAVVADYAYPVTLEKAGVTAYEVKKTFDLATLASGQAVYELNQVVGKTVMYMIIDGTNFAPTPIYYMNKETGASNEVILEEGVYKNRIVVLTVNYDALNAAIAEVEALKEADYTAETWAALKTALDAAKAATTAATQAEVDAATAALVAAKAALVELPKPDLVTVTTAAGVSTTYKSLAEASAALADGDTIKLVGDVTAEETLTISKSVTVDGDGKTLTTTGNPAIRIENAAAANITIKNITIVASKKGITLGACADAASKSTLTLTDINVTANGGEGFDGEAYWDYTVTNCNFTGSTHAFDNSGNGYNNVTITGGTFIGKSGYGLYFRNYSVITIKDATITSNGSSGIQMITAKSTEAGSKLTLTGTTNITSTGAYCVAVNPFNQLFIEGGTYKASAKDACINVNGYGSYAKITDGYFECSQNCAIRVYFSGDVTGDLPVLDIHGGTFVYNNAEGGGSALRAGTGGANGIANIYGGKFVSNGNAAPVLNTVRDDGVINIVACTVENNGPSTIAVYGKYYDGAVSVIDAFPAGATTAEYADGKLVGGEQGGSDETTVGGGDENTTVPGGDENTTVPGGDETTTTPQGTEPTDDTGCGGCGGIAVAAQLIALVCGVLGFAVIKKKN